MGISTNSKVAFICSQDETAWAQPFIDELKVPTKGRVGGFSSIDVNGAGFWDAAEENLSVPVRICEIRDGGRTIFMSSDYYGLINPARMDLPVSLQAVVYASDSCQNEPQDPIYAVRAENVRLHNFSDESEINKPAWFDYEKKSSRIYTEAEYGVDEDEDSDKFSSEAIEVMRLDRIKSFDALVEHVKLFNDLTTPFVEAPELATVMGYLKSVEAEGWDEELGYDYGGCPQYPTWDYSNEDIIYIKPVCSFTAEQQKVLNKGRELIAQEEAEEAERLKAFAPLQVGMSREEYLQAYQAALDGETDVTGVVKVIESLKLPANSDGKLKQYVMGRIKSPTSPVGQKLLAATTGEDVEFLVRSIFGKGRWNKD